MTNTTVSIPTPWDLGGDHHTSLGPDNVPSKDVFLRRWHSKAAIIDDHIYFDGGLVSQKNTEGTYATVNATLAIDLSKSWTNEDVEVLEYKYGSLTKQVLLNPAILVDQSLNTFYSWGGRAPMVDKPRSSPELWGFEANGSGGGNWKNITPGNKDDTFFDLNRPWNSAYVSTTEQGFVFGGFTDDRTTMEPVQSLPGFVSFDFKTQTWSQHADGPYSDTKKIVRGAAIFAPDFGPNGLIFIFGGISDPSAQGRRDEDCIDFATLHFMDPVSKKWYSRNTTGITPNGRHTFCSGSEAASNGRFDIFIYGGRNSRQNTTYSDVYVLSLPGFHWTRVSGSTGLERQRREHVCAVVGRRHFLSWGGVRGDPSGTYWELPDSFSQGIGIFDMSKLEWTHQYDSGADAYEQHSSISDWYNSRWDTWTSRRVHPEADAVTWSEAKGMAWSSPEVRALFVPGSGGSGGNDSTPVAAIVGGVVGGVLLAALIAGIAWLLRRRRRRARQIEHDGEGAIEMKNELGNTEPKHGTPGAANGPKMPDSRVSELQGGYLPPELTPLHKPSELDGAGIERLPAGRR